jgi:hypothetical protein
VPQFEEYNHHGIMMVVRSDLKGKHRQHCLCFSCRHFKPSDREANCPIANALYRLNILACIVTPVWECEAFEESDG